MLRLSWFKWPDLLIDYGRELYVPWQITQGKVLYADLNHLYGPLSHYLNALLFHVFGVGLSTLAYFNMCLVVILVFLIYDLFKATFGDFIATVVGVCFLVVFAFSQYVGISNYNFICPYSHEITYGIFLFFLLLFVFRKYLAKQESIFTAIMGFLVGLIFLTKVEIFIASFITILTGIIFTCWQLRPPEFRKHLFFMMVFFLFPIVAFFIYFSLHMPLVDAFGSIIAS
jgi:4-amino-4-deoxy-L-arabinose transferase-like glycosyltransferase